MGKTKAKNDSLWRIGALPFVMLWAATYAAAWIGVWALFDWLDNFGSLSNTQSNLIGVTFVSLVPALLQVPLVERLLKRSMRSWIPYSLLGTIIANLIFTDASGADSRALLTVITLFVPLAVTQMVWLWQRVNSAWLWALASLVAGIVFSIPMRSAEGSTATVIFAGLLYGLIQGGIMRYLWQSPKHAEKAKVAASQAEDDLTDHQRHLRLQEADEQDLTQAEELHRQVRSSSERTNTQPHRF